MNPYIENKSSHVKAKVSYKLMVVMFQACEGKKLGR